jgi:hypothetical protein
MDRPRALVLLYLSSWNPEDSFNLLRKHLLRTFRSLGQEGVWALEMTAWCYVTGGETTESTFLPRRICVIMIDMQI